MEMQREKNEQKIRKNIHYHAYLNDSVDNRNFTPLTQSKKKEIYSSVNILQTSTLSKQMPKHDI